MGAIRGAICAENTVQDIYEKSKQLVGEIISSNSINPMDINAIFFTATDDLDAAYPATGVRQAFALDHVAFMCFCEMKVKGSLSHCIRVCVFVQGLPQECCKHCYIGKAAALRPDLK